MMDTAGPMRVPRGANDRPLAGLAVLGHGQFYLLLRMLSESPFILYSDGKGNIFEDTSLYTTGRSGWDALPVPTEDWILLPDGGSLYELPGRRGIGVDVLTGEMRLCEKGWAVAACYPPCPYRSLSGRL